MISDKKRTEAENVHLPAWITKFDSDVIRQGFITSTIKIPKAIQETQILHRGMKLKNLNDELSELRELDPNASFISDEPTGFKTNADRIKYLEKEVYNTNVKLVDDFYQQAEYQKKLKDVRVPTAFGKTIFDPDLTLDEWQGMLGDQAVQMILSVFSAGGSTYVQEAGGAPFEIIEIEAAMKDGLLKLFIPLTPESLPKSVSIK